MSFLHNSCILPAVLLLATALNFDCSKRSQFSQSLSVPYDRDQLIATTDTLTLQLNLPFGCRIHASQGGELENDLAFSRIDLFRFSSLIFSDTTKDYILDSLKPPRVRLLADSNLEILLLTDERPNKNLQRLVVIHGTGLVRNEVIPEFLAPAKDLAGDGKPRYAGTWGLREVWQIDTTWVTDYSPILYFFESDSGIQLDSAFTIKKNAQIYGAFHGFRWNESLPMSVAVCDSPFTKEIDRILQ